MPVFAAPAPARTPHFREQVVKKRIFAVRLRFGRRKKCCCCWLMLILNDVDLCRKKLIGARDFFPCTQQQDTKHFCKKEVFFSVHFFQTHNSAFSAFFFLRVSVCMWFWFCFLLFTFLCFVLCFSLLLLFLCLMVVEIDLFFLCFCCFFCLVDGILSRFILFSLNSVAF